MKKGIVVGVSLVGLLVVYVAHIFYSTGYFRPIENYQPGKIVKKIGIHGVEDMQVNQEKGFILLSSDHRASRRDGKPVQGHIYYMNLEQPGFMPIQLTGNLAFPFYPHGISMIDLNDSTSEVLAINHVDGTHSIEVFNLFEDSLVHSKTLKDPAMISPNDVVHVGNGQFYFTNDHEYTEGLAKLGEEYLAWEVSNVVFYDGKSYRDVADGIGYANGINVDAKRNLLYVASARGFLVKVFQIQPNGDLEFVEDINCGTGVDNIEIAPDGKLWIGCHPSLLAFTAYSKGSKPTSPSEIITIDYTSKGEYVIESIYLDNGEGMSSCSVATPYKDYIFAGNVMDDHFIVMKRD